MTLIRRVSGIDFDLAAVPRGWRADRMQGYDAYIVMPAWLYYLRRLREVKWSVYRVLVHLGFWQIGEGAYYASGHWTWAWWDTLHARWMRHWADGESYRIKPASRWERFGWWIQKAIDGMKAPYA